MPRKSKASEKETGRCCGPDCCVGGAGCCGLPASDCCQVEAVVTVDGRGQMVLPKDLREMVGVRANDKLAIVAWKKEGKVCCLALLKADDLADAVRRTYGPMLNEVARG